MTSTLPTRRTASFWLLTVLTAGFCIYVLSLPVFPTEDGPIHLYFATILGNLLAHNSPLYAQYYYVHHILPPYSLHYYLLLLLMKVVSATAAEKIFVCLILCNLSFGFRYLVTGIGAAGDSLSLLIVALLFNWPLGMGFENFSFSFGLACWALGLWTRLQQPLYAPLHLRYRLYFVALLAIMTITHPIPVVLTLGFVAIDLGLRFLSDLRWRTSPARISIANLMAFCAGGVTLAYIYLFTDKHRSAQEVHARLVPFAEAVHYAHLFGLAFFGGSSVAVFAYHYALYAVLFAGVGLSLTAAWQQIRRKQWNAQLTWTVAAFLFLCGQPFIPVDINGSHLFAERLLIFIWIAFLAAASGGPQLSRFMHIAIAAFAIIFTGGVLVLAHAYLTPVALRLAALNGISTSEKGRVGLLLPGTYDQYTFNENLRFYPFDWAGTYYFRQSGSVLLNTPWMDLPILPLAALPPLLTGTFSPKQLEDFRAMRAILIHSAQARALVLPRIDFIVFNDPNSLTDQQDLDAVLRADTTYEWSCTHADWYILCDKKK